MAKYSITHVCGHGETVHLYGKGTERERRLEWMASQPCLECRHNAENEAAAKDAEARGLPALTGSDKQVAWATAIRRTMLSAMDSQLARLPEPKPEHMAKIKACRASFDTKTDARYWIDNRDRDAMALWTETLRAQNAEFFAEVDAKRAAAKAAREAEEAARCEEARREREAHVAEVKASQAAAREAAASFVVVSAERNGSDIAITGADGRNAAAYRMDGEWCVYTVDGHDVDSMTPEAESIARAALALI